MVPIPAGGAVAIGRLDARRVTVVEGSGIVPPRDQGMSTRFDQSVDRLRAHMVGVAVPIRARFCLFYAQRLRSLFEFFESRAPRRGPRFHDLLERIWSVAESGVPDVRLEAYIDDIMPGEDWVVSGFYDALAQDIGGLADGAVQGLQRDAIDRVPELSVLSAFRGLLSEMRLGRSEPGNVDEAGRKFESELHNEPLIKDELVVWQDALDFISVPNRSIAEIRSYADAHTFEASQLEPALSDGLARDAGGA